MSVPKWFDSHAHVNFKAFAQDWREVLAACLQQQVWVTLVGSQWPTSQRAVELAEAVPGGVYAAVGLHPTHVEDEPFDLAAYRSLVRSSRRVVAIGETGLDYYRLPAGREAVALERQRAVFRQHLALARELSLPLVVHCRERRPPAPPVAYREVLAMLRDAAAEGPLRGVIHCFLGTAGEAQQFLDLGFFVGFTGIVTFPTGAEQVRAVAGALPLERLVVETDAPYLAPEPHRGQRNLPTHVPLVARAIAELKALPETEVAAQTTQNALALYQIPGHP